MQTSGNDRHDNTEQLNQRIYLFVAIVAFIVTYPSWTKSLVNPQMSNYDAPWIYPGLNSQIMQDIGKSK